jgi:hypothetical protein
MNKIINIGRAFDTLFGSPRNVFAVLVGAAFWVFALIGKEQPPLGLVLNLLMMALTTGFCVRVIQQELRGGDSSQLPRWSRPEFFVSGLRLVLIENVYSAVVLLSAVAVMHQYGSQFSFNLFTPPMLTLNDPTKPLTIPWLIMAFAAVFSVYASLYLHLMSVHYAASGESVRSGFAFLTINRVLWRFLPGVLIAMVVGGVFMIATALISQFAAPFTPLLFFMQQVVLANLWAQVYKIARDRMAAADTVARNTATMPF